MQTSERASRLSSELLAFAWDEWAQMGILADAPRQSPWAQDPEALIVFTLETARDDARLFDEVLDWFLVNRALVSTRRLRTMCIDDEDRRLVNSMTALAMSRTATLAGGPPDDPEPLFRELRPTRDEADTSFLQFGFTRPRFEPSGKSVRPNLRAPINLAFRLRELLGVSARAEVVRALLTTDAPSTTRSVLVQAAGYAKPNVYDATASLLESGVLSVISGPGEARCMIERERWAELLRESPDWAPQQRDWPQLLGTLRRISRWLRHDRAELSPYMQESLTRDLLEEIAPALAYAGIAVAGVADPQAALEQTIEEILRHLRPTGEPRQRADAVELLVPPPRGSLVVEVYGDQSGKHRWRLRSPNGQTIAASPEAFSSPAAALRAAQQLGDSNRLSFDVYADAAGRSRWRATASNGQLIAHSAESFASASNAKRAMDRVREAAIAPAVR